MIDIHNHIIPGIDDGAATDEEALQLLQIAENSGITQLVCTPHIHPGRYSNDMQSISVAFKNFHKKAVDAGLSIQLAWAAEIRMSDDLLMMLKDEQLPFIGHWDGQPAILLELPHSMVPVGTSNMLNWLAGQNIRPIVVHPERNKAMMQSPDLARQLQRCGALFQLTAASVSGRFGALAQEVAFWFIDNRLVSFVASDSHNVRHRPPTMEEAYAVLSERVDENYARRLCVQNPRQLTNSLFAGQSSNE